MSVIIDGTNGISTPGVDSTNLVLDGSTSGSITVVAPAVAGTNTITLPAGTGTAAVQGVSTNIVSRTAVSASGTAVDFTSIPSWVKRVTVMFSGVSTSGTSDLLIRLGTSSGISSTNYRSISSRGSAAVTSTVGILATASPTAAGTTNGSITISAVDANTWAVSGNTYGNTAAAFTCAGDSILSGTLDRVRITTVNGTDTFDAGSINILYE